MTYKSKQVLKTCMTSVIYRVICVTKAKYVINYIYIMLIIVVIIS